MPPLESSHRRPGPLRVFVVEDHEDCRIAFCSLLEHLKYCVGSAVTVRDALEQIPQLGVDVLICDIDLPDGTGWDLMQHLVPRPRLAVALTGRNVPGDAARSRSVGFDLHLIKPLAIEQLLQRLKAAELEVASGTAAIGVT